MVKRSSIFQRVLLPGLAFKAVVIGGGYATGRELAEFFLPSGPWGGLFAMLLTMAIWSLVCVATFLFARAVGAQDYRTFFRELLGRLWFSFEVVYLFFVVLVLAVFGAAAGSMGAALFGWPQLAGTLLLMAGIGGFTTFGNSSVERLFKWVSVFLYLTYAIFVVLAITTFGNRIPASFAAAPPAHGWFFGGAAYAGYNVLGAVVILPVLRHMTSRRDAVVAGLLAGPLAIIPAILFFVSMCAYYPHIGNQVLPSDFLLERLHLPAFRLIFQVMIFSALLESGTGSIHAVNERIATAYRARRNVALPKSLRLTVAAALLIGSIFLAERFGLITLIAKGYRALAYCVILIYVVPLMTYGVWRLLLGASLDECARNPADGYALRRERLKCR
jgi:uncharacterized membrane protein YkvI